MNSPSLAVFKSCLEIFLKENALAHTEVMGLMQKLGEVPWSVKYRSD